MTNTSQYVQPECPAHLQQKAKKKRWDWLPVFDLIQPKVSLLRFYYLAASCVEAVVAEMFWWKVQNRATT